MKKVALPGDTFDIDLEADVKTHPTLGPLFGSFKLQLDVFLAPIRLYHAALHNNKLGIGLKMEQIKLPQLQIITQELDQNSNEPIEIEQISQSSLLAYLGIRGNGHCQSWVTRYYNAIPYLAYWDIYKNYYANKQEGIGCYITAGTDVQIPKIFFNGTEIINNTQIFSLTSEDGMEILLTGYANPNEIEIYINDNNTYYKATDVFINKQFIPYPVPRIRFSNVRPTFINKSIIPFYTRIEGEGKYKRTKIDTFPLENIDSMREAILKQPITTPLTIYKDALKPYGDIIYFDANYINNSKWNLCGLALKTYNSDIFNNWLSTEFIEGTNGINEITAIDTSSGSFNIDTLILAKKVYNMLNRIAVSGGTYEDWIEAVYSHEGFRRVETPIYMGGMSREIIFQEVISSAGTEYEPLASLAGKGTVSQRKKGGKITIKVDEPSYIIGIVSITPRIDYSQGNDWDVKLNSINDLHKPGLDQIGFQDLPTWEMAFWENRGVMGEETTYSAGKQPAWINYMTDFNRCYGNFADPNNEMFMTLNRRYEMDENYRIKDLTTYIDPSKFNYIFAQTIGCAKFLGTDSVRYNSSKENECKNNSKPLKQRKND